MQLEFSHLRTRQFLDPAFHAENPHHVKRFLDSLQTQIPTDFRSANEWFTLFHEGSLAINDVHTYLDLATQLDTESQEAQTRLRLFEEKVLSQLLLQRENLLDIYINSPWRHSMHADDNGKIFKELSKRKKYSKPELAQLQIDENKLVRKYKNFIHTAVATSSGTQVSLPVLVGRMHDNNSALRQSAFISYWTFIKDNEKKFQDMFSDLVENRKKQAQIANEKSYAPIAFSELGKHDYSIQECFEFHNSIAKCIVPKMTKLSETQARSLEQTSVHPWNAGSWPQITPTSPPADGNIDRLLGGFSRIVEDIHPALGRLFARMKKSGTLHINTSPNKAPGAFCVTFQESGMPFIFGNFAGNTRDAMTLLHEFCHAVHGHASCFIPNTLLRTPSMDFCEFASTGMEILAFNHFKHWWHNDNDVKKAQANHIFSMLNFWPFMAMIDAWQHEIYTSEKACDAKFRNQLWKQMSKRFRPHLDWKGIEEFEELGWLARPHIFTSPFYYIDYGIAQVGALQLWKIQKENPALAIQSYISGVSLGAQRSLTALFEASNIKLDLSQNMLGILANDMEATIRSCF